MLSSRLHQIDPPQLGITLLQQLGSALAAETTTAYRLAAIMEASFCVPRVNTDGVIRDTTDACSASMTAAETLREFVLVMDVSCPAQVHALATVAWMRAREARQRDLTRDETLWRTITQRAAEWCRGEIRSSGEPSSQSPGEAAKQPLRTTRNPFGTELLLLLLISFGLEEEVPALPLLPTDPSWTYRESLASGSIHGW